MLYAINIYAICYLRKVANEFQNQLTQDIKKINLSDMLYAIYAICYMLYAICYMLYAICYMQVQVGCQDRLRVNSDADEALA